MRNRILLIVAFLAGLNTIQLSAREPEPPAQPPRPSRPMRAARGLDKIDPKRMTEEMATDVGLDDSQKSEVQQLLTAHQQKMNDMRKQFPPATENIEKMTKIRQELKTAREANDKAKMDELMTELANIRKEEEARREPMRKAQDDAREALKGNLAAIMKPDQKQKFETYWSQKMDATHERFGGTARSPQVLKALTDRLNGLSADQKSQLDQLFKGYFDAAKRNGANESANDVLVKKLYDDVLNVLNPEQRQQIEAKIKGNQRARGPRPGQSPPEQKNQPKQNGG